MKDRIVIEISSGLQEQEGRTDISVWGVGSGTTLREVCKDIIRKHPKKGKDFASHSPNNCSTWGMELRFLDGLTASDILKGMLYG